MEEIIINYFFRNDIYRFNNFRENMLFLEFSYNRRIDAIEKRLKK